MPPPLRNSSGGAPGPASDSSRLARLRRLVEADPADDLLRYMLGSGLLGAGRCEEAAAELRRAVGLNPSYSAAWKDLGKALHLAGEPAEAASVLEQGIAVARDKGDLQAVREMEVWLRRARGEESRE